MKDVHFTVIMKISTKMKLELTNKWDECFALISNAPDRGKLHQAWHKNACTKTPDCLKEYDSYSSFRYEQSQQCNGLFYTEF